MLKAEEGPEGSYIKQTYSTENRRTEGEYDEPNS